MIRVARSAAAAEAWARTCVERRRALEPLLAALKRERWTPTTLVDELARGPRLSVNRSTLYSYLSGAARIPARVFWAICQIAGMSDWELLAQGDNEALLIQPAKGSSKRKSSARK